jgi:hypothetical protein
MSNADKVVPNLNYAEVDYEELRKNMTALIPLLTSEWSNANDTDLGVTLINTFCGLGDMLAYYLNEQAKETYLPTARLRQSIIDVTKIIGYRLSRPNAASATVTINFPTALETPLYLNQYDVLTTENGETDFVITEDKVVLTNMASVDVTLVQGIPAVEEFTSTGGTIQEYRLSSTQIAEQMLKVYVGEEEIEYSELQKDIYITGNSRTYFVADTDAFDTTTIKFSDAYGLVPLAGDKITIKYINTRGAGGKVTSGSIRKAKRPDLLPVDARIVQSEDAQNGSARESEEFAKLQAPREIRTLWRAVTTEDYQTLLDGFPGVLISSVFDHEKDPTIPIHQVVCVVSPTGGGNLSEQFREQLQSFLARVRMTTVDVVIKNPTYVDLDIEAKIHITRMYDQNKVISDVLTSLEEQFGLGKLGFGESVRFSQIVSVLQSIQGVSYVEMVSPLEDILVSPYEIIKLGTPNITIGGVV